MRTHASGTRAAVAEREGGTEEKVDMYFACAAYTDCTHILHMHAGPCAFTFMHTSMRVYSYTCSYTCACTHSSDSCMHACAGNHTTRSSCTSTHTIARHSTCMALINSDPPPKKKQGKNLRDIDRIWCTSSFTVRALDSGTPQPRHQTAKGKKDKNKDRKVGTLDAGTLANSDTRLAKTQQLGASVDPTTRCISASWQYTTVPSESWQYTVKLSGHA